MRMLVVAFAIVTGVFLVNQAVAATQYEAENATLTGNAKKNTNHSGYSGTGFVDGFYYSTTAQASFAVNSPAAGSATVTLRYCAGNGTSTNTGLYVNGTKIKNITCNSTGNWDTWANQTETVTLNAGNNTIAYKTETSVNTCINLDYISVQTATTTYSLTMSNDGRGTTTPTGTITVNSGAATSISATASSGYQFQNWTVTAGTATIASATSASTTVTLSSGNATIRANFTAIVVDYSLTMSNDGHGTTTPSGTITVNSGVATSISASASSGYQFQNWTVTAGTATIASATSASTTVTLSSGNATVRANFSAIPSSTGAVAYAEISYPVTVTASNTTVLALTFTAPSAGYITVTATGLYGTNSPYSDEQRGLESFVTLNSTSGGSLSGFFEKAPLSGSAQYVSETAGFQVTTGSNTVRLVVTPRKTLTSTTYKFVKCRMTVVFSPNVM
jgi:hypothetical protein